MAGSVCGLMLADMGADVVKVEKIAGADDSRRFVPPDVAGESAAFMMMDRNEPAAISSEHRRENEHDDTDHDDKESQSRNPCGAECPRRRYRAGEMALCDRPDRAACRRAGASLARGDACRGRVDSRSFAVPIAGSPKVQDSRHLSGRLLD